MSVQNDQDSSGRTRLLDAASELFQSAAYREVSVKDITNLSGIQAPSLYHHFGDKEGLYVAWAETALIRLGEMVAEELTGKTNTRDQLIAMAKALLRCKHMDLIVVMRDSRMMARSESQERILQAYLAALFEPLGGILVRGVERGKIRPEPIARMANVFVLGALSLGKAYAMESISVDDGAVWWTKRFVNGFGA